MRYLESFVENNSGIVLILFVISGFLSGSILKKENKWISRFLNIIVFTLLFIMGMILGNTPEIISRIASYGKSALIIVVCSMFFSTGAVFLLLKLLKRST